MPSADHGADVGVGITGIAGPDGGLWFPDMYRYLIEHPMWMLCFLVLTALSFSLFGFIIGLWAGYWGSHLIGIGYDADGPSASGLLVLGLTTMLGSVSASTRGLSRKGLEHDEALEPACFTVCMLILAISGSLFFGGLITSLTYNRSERWSGRA